MVLTQLSLLNYKNFDSKELVFNQKINCFVGANGKGKTNILDAIYHLCFGKGYFNPVASQNIKHGADFFVIEGHFEKEDREEKIVCSLKKNHKKIIKRNGKIYDRLSDHIGLLPLVIISPADRDLILEGSETRRKFIDGVISQSDKNYLTQLLKYNKVVSQRNALLKFFAANHTFDATTLSVYNEQMTELGEAIYGQRIGFLESFIPIFQEQYKAITGDVERVELSYSSKLLDTPMQELLENALEKDRALQYTSAGVHKDDLNFTIADYPIKKFGSQGQQKSFLTALKFAQFHFLKAQSKTTPLLLLDDIFDKLDAHRVAQIIALVNNRNFGQLFITDTHAERTEEVIKQTHQRYDLFKL